MNQFPAACNVGNYYNAEGQGSGGSGLHATRSGHRDTAEP